MHGVVGGPKVRSRMLVKQSQKLVSLGGAVLDVWWHGFSWYQNGSWPASFNFSSLPNVPWPRTQRSGELGQCNLCFLGQTDV